MFLQFVLLLLQGLLLEVLVICTDLTRLLVCQHEVAQVLLLNNLGVPVREEATRVEGWVIARHHLAPLIDICLYGFVLSLSELGKPGDRPLVEQSRKILVS